MWETYVKIASPENLTQQQILNTIRFKLHPMLESLYAKKAVRWYSFLIHSSRKAGDQAVYFHIRFEPKPEINTKDEVNLILPDFCEKNMTELCKNVEDVETIRGISESILKGKDIEEAWKILGEQSEWLMNMLNAYEEKAEMPIGDITQFMHFYLNMVGLGGRAILFLGPTFSF
jgi:hypothetical protein